MKAAGQILPPEADIIIEESYLDLMESYPTDTLSDYAAIHLGEICMAQGKRTEACAYFGWFLMNADSNDCRIAYINEQCRRNSDE
ncbi:MAG: tetratricopeptide repeat protein [Sedimentisphaerales bacterium]